MSKMGNYVVELMENGLWEEDENLSEPNFDEYYSEQLSRFKHELRDCMQSRNITWKEALTFLYQTEEDDYELFDIEEDAYCYQKLEHFLYKWDLQERKIDEICKKFFISP